MYSANIDESIDLAQYGVGDLVLEGRQGNSIRIGSRSHFPHIFISNGRFQMEGRETLDDDTLIAITSMGTLNEHFLKPYIPSSNVDNNERKILYNDSSGAQIFIRSNKITFDSRAEPITFTSNNKIVLGSNTDVEIHTKESTLINSKNIYIGNDASKKDEPIVLGNELVTALEKIIDNIVGE